MRRYLVCCGITQQDETSIESIKLDGFTNDDKSREELKNLMVVKETNFILLPVIPVKDMCKIGDLIAPFLDTNSIIIIVDLIESKGHIYQGTTIESSKTLYIPRFLEIYKLLFNQGIPHIEDIVDYSGNEQENESVINTSYYSLN